MTTIKEPTIVDAKVPPRVPQDTGPYLETDAADLIEAARARTGADGNPSPPAPVEPIESEDPADDA